MTGQIKMAYPLIYLDMVVLDRVGHLPITQSAAALMFNLLSRLYKHVSVVIHTTRTSRNGAMCLRTLR
jgi:DNA replication protein DnaC